MEADKKRSKVLVIETIVEKEVIDKIIAKKKVSELEGHPLVGAIYQNGKGIV